MRLFGDKVLNSINKKISTDIWEKAFEGASSNVSFFGKGLGLELATHRCILRYFHATFHDLNVKVTVENLAIAIAMELYSFGNMIEPKYIYDFSEAILKNWYSSLRGNEYFNNNYSDQINQISYKKDEENMERVMNVLSSKDEVYIEYFNSYRHENSSTAIKVWLPRPNESWIRWEEEHSIDIHVNPMIGFELGFFRTGFDYSEFETEEKSRLQVVFYSGSSYREGAKFKTLRIGEETGDIIWAR
jgi:hypothetical protein